VTRTLRVTSPANVTRNITVTKADYALSPVSSRYGAQIIVDGTKRVGYLNLRTFISTADPQLRTAFDQFRAAGITEFIIDFRYNGGGLVSTADLMGDLLGGNRATSEIFSQTTYRASKSSNSSIKRFARASQAVSPVKIAFIGTGATASASELVINGFIPYLGANVGLIGANTFGKPVGQVALDRAACDDRLRAIAFSLRNSANSDAYYDGLASAVQASCAAADDVKFQLGDSREASVRQALDYLAGRACTPIAVGQTAQAVQASKPQLLRAAIPTVGQREVPGLF
jgi:carboxyl-terminal processing protease